MLVNNNRFPITEEGVVIPKIWFGEATEVEIRQENGHLVVVPVDSTRVKKKSDSCSADDPIWKWGENPVDTGITDGSLSHDKYIYDDPHRLQR